MELQADGVEIQPDYPLVQECGHCLLEALQLGRLGAEGELVDRCEERRERLARPGRRDQQRRVALRDRRERDRLRRRRRREALPEPRLHDRMEGLERIHEPIGGRRDERREVRRPPCRARAGLRLCLQTRWFGEEARA